MSLTGGSKFILTGGATNYQIPRSLRFRDGSSAFLNRTPGVAGNRKQWTLSLWVKRAKLGAEQALFAVEPTTSGSDTNRLNISFDSSDRLTIFSHSTTWRTTTRVFRDTSAWYHIVIGWNTSSGNNSITIEINGVTETVFTTNNALTINTDYGIGTTNPYRIGASYNIAGVFTQNYLGAYLAEVHHVDGQTLPATTFGAFNAVTGVWDPKVVGVGVSYGTTGFYLPFSDNSGATSTTIGKDFSANGNNFTPNNISVTAGTTNDSLVDTPTNYGTDTGAGGEVRGNYCTLNPLMAPSTGSTVSTLSNGNLDAVGSATKGAFGTIQIPSTGKWYFEYTNTSFYYASYGIGTSAAQGCGSATGMFGFYQNGSNLQFNIGNNSNIGSSSGIVSQTNDIGLICIDNDNGKIWMGRSRSGVVTWAGGGTPGSSSPTWSASGQGGTYSTNYVVADGWFPLVSGGGADSWSVNFGQRPFAYAAPSGFKALCTQNLPIPTIGS